MVSLMGYIVTVTTDIEIGKESVADIPVRRSSKRTYLPTGPPTWAAAS